MHRGCHLNMDFIWICFGHQISLSQVKGVSKKLAFQTFEGGKDRILILNCSTCKIMYSSPLHKNY
jgi:hypothetical protein